MALQIRRGTNAERLTITPLQGELLFTTDTKNLYVGDGTTQGGVVIEGGGGEGVAANAFASIAVAGQSTVSADSSEDTLTLIAGSNVTITTNATNDSITIASSAGATNLDALTDVIISSPNVDQVLKYNGTNWINGAAPSASATLFFPFYKSSGAADSIGLISNSILPFTNFAGTSKNITLTSI
jgi:D-arabinose 1-dehydrogenase-like Zn-dependent alcohol dehydrogenase